MLSADDIFLQHKVKAKSARCDKTIECNPKFVFFRIAIMNLRLLNSKRLFAALCFFVTCVLIYQSFYKSATVCYFAKEWKDGKTLKNVQENLRLRSHDSPKNIFFHETSCTTDGIVRLNSRQACAIESSAKMNPEHEIFVLFTSQVGFRNTSRLVRRNCLRLVNR